MRLPKTNKVPGRVGAAAVELAILVPLLCFLFVIAVDWGRVFYFDLTVENCARSGALYAGRDPKSAVDTAGIVAEAQKDAPNLDVSKMTVTSNVDSLTAPTVATVTVNYPFSTISNFPGVSSSLTLSRTVTVMVAPAKPNP
jgi:Flp pilus assembly protein TadG